MKYVFKRMFKIQSKNIFEKNHYVRAIHKIIITILFIIILQLPVYHVYIYIFECMFQINNFSINIPKFWSQRQIHPLLNITIHRNRFSHSFVHIKYPLTQFNMQQHGKHHKLFHYQDKSNKVNEKLSRTIFISMVQKFST